MTTTQASAIVTRCGVDVTDEYTENIFNWTLDSGNIEADTVWNAAHAGMKSITCTATDLNGDVKISCTLTASSATYGSVTVDDDMDASHNPAELDANDVFAIENGNLKVTTSRGNAYVLESSTLKASGAKLNGSITAETKLFASQPEDIVEFSYNHNGLRTQKKVTKPDGTVETTEYTLHGKLLAHLRRGSDEMHFFYDAQERVALIEFNGNLYNYIYNVQGDVLKIIDSNGNPVIEYHYNVWGEPATICALETKYTAFAELNPFRYRGYIWDAETEMYFLNSRYYMPSLCRFIILDEYVIGAVGDVINHNGYIYCGNKTVSREDENGDWFLTCLIGAAISVAVEYVSDVVENFQKGERGIEAFVPDSPVTDYVAAAAGGFIAAIPGGGYVGTAIAGGASSVVDKAIRGEIDSVEDGVKAFTIGAASNALGKFTSEELVSRAEISRIKVRPRQTQKRYAQRIFGGKGRDVNDNLRKLKEVSIFPKEYFDHSPKYGTISNGLSTTYNYILNSI